MKKLLTYFTDINDLQHQQLRQLQGLYADWNKKINVVSRKDIDALYERHVLHALGIAKVISFLPHSKILDVGTGGGFPGIPLAILFPETEFYLVDSIQKKIGVVNAVASTIGLTNIQATHQRVEQVEGKFDFVVSRAVTQMSPFVEWVQDKISSTQKHDLVNGILALKGGDLTKELKPFPKATLYPLTNYFQEEFFTTKYVVHLPFNPYVGNGSL
jgi:16S rRNA (guanine527-N7)-methyltransferase